MVTELYVERLVAGGSGLAQLDGMKVFVPFAAPQERILARIRVRKRDYAIAEIRDIIEPSPLRVSPPCPHYPDRCGGCQLQHISYPGQLIAKKLIVNDALQHIGKVFVPVTNIADGEAWHYRNKTQYPVARQDEVRIGFFRRGTHHVTDIPVCLLHPPGFDSLRKVALAAIREHESAYDEKYHQGNIRHLILRRGDDGVMVLLVTREENVSSGLVDAIAAQSSVTGIVQSV
ncbi:MAG: 23S rRNA (uracil-5-)-methyltransferase RumA, partial [candidate division WOR-3 bacterium]